MKTFEVTRYYTVANVYTVKADSAEEAYKKACDHEYEWHKSYDSPEYDSPEDDNYEVEEVTA